MASPTFSMVNDVSKKASAKRPLARTVFLGPVLEKIVAVLGRVSVHTE